MIACWRAAGPASHGPGVVVVTQRWFVAELTEGAATSGDHFG